MAPDLEVPRRIAQEVRATEGSLTFPSSTAPWEVGLLTVVIGAVCAFDASAVAAMLALLILAPWGLEVALSFLIIALALGVLFLTPAIGLGLLLAFESRRQVRLTRSGAQLTGIYTQQLPVGSLTLRGEVGGPVELRLGDRLLRAFQTGWGEHGWNHDAITWLAERAAGLLGQELDDQRVEAHWRRWEQDPVYRSQVGFARDDRANREAFPEHHNAPAAEPSWVRRDHHGLSWERPAGMLRSTPMRLSSTLLHRGSGALPLHAITHVRIAVQRHTSNYGSYDSARILVLAGQQTIEVYRRILRADRDIAGLQWLANEIEQAARRAEAPRDQGSSEDVPEELGQVRRQAMAQRAAGSERP